MSLLYAENWSERLVKEETIHLIEMDVLSRSRTYYTIYLQNKGINGIWCGPDPDLRSMA